MVQESAENQNLPESVRLSSREFRKAVFLDAGKNTRGLFAKITELQNSFRESVVIRVGPRADADPRGSARGRGRFCADGISQKNAKKYADADPRTDPRGRVNHPRGQKRGRADPRINFFIVS